MSVSFTVPTNFVKPFLSTLTCACKLSDTIFLLPHADSVELLCVHPSHSSHLLLTIDARHLEGYRYQAPQSSGHPPSNGEDEADSHPESGHGLTICILARTLLSTLLRQSINALRSIYISYGGGGTVQSLGLGDHTSLPDGDHQGNSACDRIHFECAMNGGITKCFHLHLCDGSPKRVAADERQYHFVLRGEAQLFGRLLSYLPSSARQCMIEALEERVELRWAEGGSTAASGAPAASTTAGRGSKAGRGGGADASGSGLTGVVSAYPSSFAAFQFYTTEEGVDAQEEAERPVPFFRLPTKVVEGKPLKQLVWLACQLELPLELRVGAAGCPVVVKASAAAAAQARQMPSSLGVECTLHMAALDVSIPPSAVAEEADRASTVVGATPNGSGAAVPQQSQSLVQGTASTTAASSARPSSVVPATPLPAHILTASSATLMRHPTNAITVLPTHASMPSIEVTMASMGDLAAAQQRSSTAHSESVVPPTFASDSQRSFVDASYVPASYNVEGGTQTSAAVAAAVVSATPPQSTAFSRDFVSESFPDGGSAVCVPATLASTRSSLAMLPPPPPQQLVFSPSQTRSSMPTLTVLPPSSSNSNDGVMSAPSATAFGAMGGSRLSALYPLDYEAFAASRADEDDSAMAAGEDDDDEDLQRFLESCTTIMVNGSAVSSPSQIAENP